MWQFQDIRAGAIKALESLTLSMDPVDKIVMARKFDVSPWLITSLHALARREKPLDLSEGNRLGLEWALKVAEVRECGAQRAPTLPTCQYCHYGGPVYCSSCGSCRQSQAAVDGRASIDYEDKIREIFGLK